jgi:hypothetical protein
LGTCGSPSCERGIVWEGDGAMAIDDADSIAHRRRAVRGGCMIISTYTSKKGANEWKKMAFSKFLVRIIKQIMKNKQIKKHIYLQLAHYMMGGDNIQITELLL